MRSYEPIELEDLARLADIAAADRRRFYRTRPEYAERYLGAALCQGAAQHYVDLARGSPSPAGVKDLDVWSFFAALPATRFPAARRLTHATYDPPPLGPRRIDLLLRALPTPLGADPAQAIRTWLSEGRTESARRLAQKAAVLLDPPDLRGHIIWPVRI